MDTLTLFFVELYVVAGAACVALIGLALLANRRARPTGVVLLVCALMVMFLNRYMAAHPEHLPKREYRQATQVDQKGRG